MSTLQIPAAALENMSHHPLKIIPPLLRVDVSIQESAKWDELFGSKFLSYSLSDVVTKKRIGTDCCRELILHPNFKYLAKDPLDHHPLQDFVYDNDYNDDLLSSLSPTDRVWCASTWNSEWRLVASDVREKLTDIRREALLQICLQKIPLTMIVDSAKIIGEFEFYESHKETIDLYVPIPLVARDNSYHYGYPTDIEERLGVLNAAHTYGIRASTILSPFEGTIDTARVEGTLLCVEPSSTRIICRGKHLFDQGAHKNATEAEIIHEAQLGIKHLKKIEEIANGIAIASKLYLLPHPICYTNKFDQHLMENPVETREWLDRCKYRNDLLLHSLDSERGHQPFHVVPS